MIYKIVPLQIVSGVYVDIRDFETLFKAQISRFDSHNSGNIPDALVALIILWKSNIDDDQRVSISEAAVSNVVTAHNTKPAVDEMLSSVWYASTASVLRQCERMKCKYPWSRWLLHSEAGKWFWTRFRKVAETISFTPIARRSYRIKRQKAMSLLQENILATYGHRFPDHNDDALIKPSAISSDTPISDLTNNGDGKLHGNGKHLIILLCVSLQLCQSITPYNAILRFPKILKLNMDHSLMTGHPAARWGRLNWKCFTINQALRIVLLMRGHLNCPNMTSGNIETAHILARKGNSWVLQIYTWWSVIRTKMLFVN